jgi:hypothetical protein
LNNKELEQLEQIKKESVDCIISTINNIVPTSYDLADCIEFLKPYAFGFFICSNENVFKLRNSLIDAKANIDFCLYNWCDLKIIRFMKIGEPEVHIKPEIPTLEEIFKQADDPYYYWIDKKKIKTENEAEKTTEIKPEVTKELEIEKVFVFDVEEQFFKARIPEKVKQTYPDFNIESKSELLSILIEMCTDKTHLVFDPYNENSEVAQITEKINRRFVGFNLYYKDKTAEEKAEEKAKGNNKKFDGDSCYDWL